MADPVSIVDKVIGSAFAIKGMVETARDNKEECRDIEKRVARLRPVLSQLRNSAAAEVTEKKNPVLSDALDDMAETLRQALKLVTSCQRRNVVRRCCKARKLSKQLRKVHDDISYEMLHVLIATTAQIVIPQSDHLLVPTDVSFMPPPVKDSLRPEKMEYGLPYCFSFESDDDVYKGGTKMPSHLFPGLTKFSLSELEAATDGFAAGNVIGGGGSSGSSVFKGVLHGELVVAIKKFKDPPKSLVARISNELHIASKLQHKVKNKNIIRILGYGHEEIQKHGLVDTHIFIIEEYMANGNMGNIIHGCQYGWTSRFRIIQGIASGLSYLHEQHIVHFDLKPSNILLDSDMSPQISGLGRARELFQPFSRDDSIAGTVGYMPPEYILQGTLSAKYDIYSFGITLLETISSMYVHEPSSHQAPLKWAWEAHEGGRMGELLNPSLCDEPQLTELRRCMQLGLICAQEKTEDRPDMTDVLGMLNAEKELTNPIRPEHTTKRKPRATGRGGALHNCF